MTDTNAAPAVADTTQQAITQAPAAGVAEKDIFGFDKPADLQAPAVESEQKAPVEAEQKTDQTPAVPDAYEFTLPEGYAMSDEQSAAATELFKSLGLSQSAAQALLEFDAQRAAITGEAQMEQARQQVQAWGEELKNDPDFGGAKFQESVAVSNKALTEFGTPELSTFLKESGLGSHPAVVKFFHNVGKQLGEGQLHRSNTELPAPRAQDAMFGHLFNE